MSLHLSVYPQGGVLPGPGGCLVLGGLVPGGAWSQGESGPGGGAWSGGCLVLGGGPGPRGSLVPEGCLVPGGVPGP